MTWSGMMVMIRAGSSVVLIRMSPLATTSKVGVRMAAVRNATIDNVSRRMRLDHFRTRDGSHPGRTAEPSLVFTLLLSHVVILSIVGNGEVAIVEGTGGSQRGAVSAEGKPH